MADRDLGLDIEQILDDIAHDGWESVDEASRSERYAFHIKSEVPGGADALLAPIDGAYNFEENPVFQEREGDPVHQPHEPAREEAIDLDAASDVGFVIFDEDEAQADRRRRRRQPLPQRAA